MKDHFFKNYCLSILGFIAVSSSEVILAQDSVIVSSAQSQVVSLPENQAYLKAQQEILSSFEAEKLPVYEMTVTDYNGEITLSGYVNTAAEAEKAAQLALEIQGVTKVHNYLVPKFIY